MTRPNSDYYEWTLLESKDIPNSFIYEHWENNGCDEEHHIHLPSGVNIIFGHESCEGSVRMEGIEDVTSSVH